MIVFAGLVAGIIFLVAPTWFTGQHTVGLVLTIAFGLITLLQYALVGAFARKFKRW